MKKAISVLSLLLFFLAAHSQERSAVDYYNDGMKYAQRGSYKEAINYFDMAIQLKPDDYFSLHNRGIAKSLMKNYEGAITDFKKVLNYKHDYVAAYIALGNCYKRLTYYDTAINYYSAAISLEEDNTEAFYHRAHVYESMNMVDSAADDFKTAFDLGATQVEDKVKFYKDTAKNRPQYHSIGKITKTSPSATYGFAQNNPIKVGTTAKGGFVNVIAYLSQLRDEKRKPIQYTRIKACCPHKLAGSNASVMLEEYQITYYTAAEGQKTTTLYLSYYEYDAPLAPMGFTGAK